MPSPCLTCDFKDDDKNNERCANCEKRIEYARKELLIPTEALEADLAAREQTKKIQGMAPPGKKRGPKSKAPAGTVTMEEIEDAHGEQIMDINETQMAIDAADLKAGESSKKKRGWPKGKKRGPRPKPVEEKVVLGRPRQPTGRYYDRFRLSIAPKKSDERVMEILETLRQIAKLEYRKPNEQALCFIKQGIDKWKKEHKGGI